MLGGLERLAPPPASAASGNASAMALSCWKSQVPHEPLTYGLEVAGLLSPEQLEDRHAISRAVEALLQEWLSRVTSETG